MRLRDLADKARRAPHRWYERARYGYSREDTWSFDTYLAGVIAGGVAELRARGIGHPDDLSPEEWDDILTRIERPLLRYHNDVFECSATESVEIVADAQEAARLMAEYFPALWD